MPAGTYYWSVRSTREVGSANVITGASTTTTTQYATPFSFRLCGANVAPSSTALSTPTNGASFISATYTTTNSIAAIAVTLKWTDPTFGVTCYAGTNLLLVSWTQDPTVKVSFPL